MENYPLPARRLVEEMAAKAAAEPARAVAYQGAPGANSHLAALGYAPDCIALPCFSFQDAIDAVQEGQAERAIIPIENSLHGRVADMHRSEEHTSELQSLMRISYAVFCLKKKTKHKNKKREDTKI